MIHRPTTAPSGAVETTFHRIISRRAEVRKVEPVGDDFRLVTLVGEELQHRSWTPGDMVQIAFAGWVNRAYTPLSYNPRLGAIDFLGYVHGNGIGSAWLASPIIGERLFFVGPRSAVDLNALRRPALFFGDETSFSTAAALAATPTGVRDVTFIFEVTSIEGARNALDRLGMTDAVTLVLRQEGDRHLDEIEREMLATFGANREMQGMFTGKGSSIQRLYKALRGAGIPSRHVTNLVYWAPEKKGLSGALK